MERLWASEHREDSARRAVMGEDLNAPSAIRMAVFWMVSSFLSTDGEAAP